MTYKNAITMTTLSVIAVFAIGSIFVLTNDVQAITTTNFKMADNTYAKVKFTFRSGVEEIHFPVFKMTSSFVENKDTSFQLQGIVEDYPLLNEAMDQTYDFRSSSPETPYEYKQFGVDIEFIKSGILQKILHYEDCRISNSSVDTLSDNAEGYTTTKTGFAIINVIDFTCSGVDQITAMPNYHRNTYSQLINDYGKHTQKLSEDVHSYVTFFFNDGKEKMDFPVFKMNSGFSEASINNPSFTVQGIVTSHSLLDRTINEARATSGIPSLSNDKFDVQVDFANNYDILRSLVYSDCRIEEYKIDTLFDKEEGYTGKSGFAIVDEVSVKCAGVDTKNYSGVKTDQKNIVLPNPYTMGGSTQAFVTITLDNGEQEKLNLPVFKQTSTVTKVSTKTRFNPSFQLQGVVGDFPVLYKAVDQLLTKTYYGAVHQDLFSVDVDLIHNNKLVKTYQYTQCRVINYDVDTAYNNEEGYVGANGFAIVTTYDFECYGYQQSNPSFEQMNAVEKAHTESSSDRKRKDTWGPEFTVY